MSRFSSDVERKQIAAQNGPFCQIVSKTSSRTMGVLMMTSAVCKSRCVVLDAICGRRKLSGSQRFMGVSDFGKVRCSSDQRESQRQRTRQYQPMICALMSACLHCHCSSSFIVRFLLRISIFLAPPTSTIGTTRFTERAGRVQ